MNNPTPPTDFAERAARISLSHWAGETTTAAEAGLVEGLDAIRLALLAIVDTGRNQVEQMRIGNLLAAADVLKSGEALAALRTNEGSGEAPAYRLRPEIRDALMGAPVDDVVDAEVHCSDCDTMLLGHLKVVLEANAANASSAFLDYTQQGRREFAQELLATIARAEAVDHE